MDEKKKDLQTGEEEKKGAETKTYNKGAKHKSGSKDSGGKGKGKKKQGGEKSGSPKDNGEKHRNDPSWYTVNDTIGKAVANIPFNVFPGNRFPGLVAFDPNPDAPSIDTSGRNCSYGVMDLAYTPCMPVTEKWTDAVNMAARALYTYVRHQNSGSKNYDAPDLMLYILAMDQIYLAYFEACRIYRAVYTYSLTNKLFARVVGEALRIDVNALIPQLPELRSRLNLAAAKINSLAVPNIFKIFNRRAYLGTNIFFDSSATTSQVFLYSAMHYGKFDATTESTGGSLRWINRATSMSTAASVMANLDTLINAVLEDEDMNVMSGDILKAYGSDKLYSLKTVEDVEVLAPIYDTEILCQIQNTRSLGNITVPSITQQANGALKFIPTKSNDFYAAAPIIINSSKDEPDWKDVLEYSQCICALNPKFEAGTTTRRATCCSELVQHFNTFAVRQDGTISSQYLESYVKLDAATIATTAQISFFARCLVEFNQLDWHPMISIWTEETIDDTLTIQFHGFATDIRRAALWNFDGLEQRHQAAGLSLFGVDASAAKPVS